MSRSLNTNGAPSFIQRSVMKWWFWLPLVAFFFAYPVFRSMNRELPPELPVLYQLPEYTLLDENSQAYGSGNLKDKLYVASFHFTRCPTICVKIIESMKKIQSRVSGLGQNIALVSFTVDPTNDTPAVLQKFARKNKANPYVWKFLTSEKRNTIKDLVVQGFKLAVGDPEKYNNNGNIEINEYDIAHSEKFVLVDGKGQIRAFYGNEKSEIDRMMIDIGLLINRDKMLAAK